MDLQFIFADIKKGNKFFKIFYHEKLFIIQFCFGSFSHKFDCMFFNRENRENKQTECNSNPCGRFRVRRRQRIWK